MNFLTSRKTALFRKNGRVAVYLIIELPWSTECVQFAAFYEKIAEAYYSLAEKIKNGFNGKYPVSICASFLIETEKTRGISPRFFKKHPSAIVIKRTITVKQNGNLKVHEFTDIYDEKDGYFVK